MKVLISGGTGMIGQALARSLLQDGHEISVLTRAPAKTRLPAGVSALQWDGRTTCGWGGQMNDIDAVVNLVGERLSKWPWTARQRSRFVESRVDGGMALAEAIRAAGRRPRVFIQASGMNYYGPQEGPTRITEASPRGRDFLADLCEKWEGSTLPVESMGVRRVIIRSGIVLNAHDGILPIMMLPDRMFVGGRLGTGKQGLPWIHQEDEVAAICFLLDNEASSGPFNLTAPSPISSAEFLRVLARAMRRPYWFPVPGWVLSLVLGGMATLVLDGMYAVPQRLEEQGFKFKFRQADAALQDILRQ